MAGQLYRIRFRLLAATIAAAAQVFIAAAPLAEGRFGPDARAHIESAGTSLHHAHDDATCAACVSQHLLAAAEPGRPHDLVFIVSSSRPRSVDLSADSRVPRFFAKSRAPPAITV
jgi:hypothetical protein